MTLPHGIVPVPLTWAMQAPAEEPDYLPTPTTGERFGCPPLRAAGGGTRYMLPDGRVYEYKGESGYAIDNAERINGWYRRRDLELD